MSSKPQQLTPFGYALAGALGGVFSNALVYPLDTVKTKIQANATSSTGLKGKERADSNSSILSLLVRIYYAEGIAGYYKGFGASMLNTFSMQYSYFFFYGLVRNTYIKRTTKPGVKPSPLSTAVELSLGAIAGALAQIFTLPVSVIATRQQVGKASAKEVVAAPSAEDTEQVTLATNPKEGMYDDSFLGVAREIIHDDGIRGLWSGLRPGLVLTVNPAITYGVFERVKSVFTLGDPTIKLGPGRSFCVGALSKTLATVVTYPYIMAKVRIQAGSKTKGTSNQEHSGGAVDILSRVYRKEGLVGWYKGMGAQITKAVLSQALLFMSKDQFEQYALILMIVWGRLTNAAHS